MEGFKIRSNSGPYMQHTKYTYKIGQSDIFLKPDFFLKKSELARTGSVGLVKQIIFFRLNVGRTIRHNAYPFESKYNVSKF